MDPTRFSRWRPLAERGDMPALPAVIQIKAAGELLQYDSGRSAMLWYGAGDDGVSVIEGACGELERRWPALELVWRFRPSSAPAHDLTALIGRFERRFGAPPLGNTA